VSVDANTLKKEGPVEKVTAIGVDLAKEVFQLHGANHCGKGVFKKRVRRGELLKELERFSGAKVYIEATRGAHHWAREPVPKVPVPKVL
jgi:transposase